LSVAIGGYLATALLVGDAADDALLAPARALLLPGDTTHGHHQIELACESCHAETFAGREGLQGACEGCHAAELKAARDTHPLSKFTDPRNADRLEKLDATLCVTCHVEHRPGITLAMGVTQPGDFCFHCHAEIARDRPSHAGLHFDTCNSAGCHKYHDNRALYEDFLAKHLDDPPLLSAPKLRLRETGRVREMHEAHAKVGSANESACRECHEQEVKGFLAGKHGMRRAVRLSAMTPRKSRLPMRTEARHEALGCASCHAAPEFDTRKAAVEACLGCHSDRHSLAYEGSAHHALWKKELAGELPAGSGVSCASCHMPRIEHRDEDLGARRTLVQHNQSETLAPREKMARPVCLSCHGLGFSLDALAGRRVESLDMVRQRFIDRERKNP
jgi:formate-dependent nitrite reductase cytochrome c552 subunit